VILASAAEMREIDRIAIEEMGVPGIDLMERAGGEVTRAIAEEFAPIAGKRVVVVAGRGNNGGDGFVVARRLREAGADARVALVGARDGVRGDAAKALARAETAGVPVRALAGAGASDRGDGVAAAVTAALDGCDVAVDALLGTGSSGEPRGDVAAAIDALVAFRGPVVAIDVPSGVDATSGAAPGPAVHADLTVTLALAKTGLFLYPGCAHVGRLRGAPIGIPDAAVERVAPRASLFDASALPLPERAHDAHKGSAGRVLVVGASPGLTGSVYLAGMAALRAGAGVATLAVPRSLQPILAAKATELMTFALPETKAHVLGTPAAAALLDFADGFDVIALGPGLSRSAEVRGFLGAVLAGWRRALVLDADALWMLAKGLPRLAKAGARGASIVVTPHVGEAERLTGEERAAIEADRVGFARRSAEAMAGTFLLKGNPTVVADREGRATLNTSGNRGMATAGAGDVLTGLVAGLVAQGMEAASAARAGAYLHGRAGDFAAAALGWRSIVAGDLLAYLPAAIREVDERAAGEPRDPRSDASSG
jgi:NAD(P)H-hydrate epimerase